jgi:hypothetical protein
MTAKLHMVRSPVTLQNHMDVSKGSSLTSNAVCSLFADIGTEHPTEHDDAMDTQESRTVRNVWVMWTSDEVQLRVLWTIDEVQLLVRGQRWGFARPLSATRRSARGETVDEGGRSTTNLGRKRTGDASKFGVDETAHRSYGAEVEGQVQLLNFLVKIPPL